MDILSIILKDVPETMWYMFDYSRMYPIKILDTDDLIWDLRAGMIWSVYAHIAHNTIGQNQLIPVFITAAELGHVCICRLIMKRLDRLSMPLSLFVACNEHMQLLHKYPGHKPANVSTCAYCIYMQTIITVGIDTRNLVPIRHAYRSLTDADLREFDIRKTIGYIKTASEFDNIDAMIKLYTNLVNSEKVMDVLTCINISHAKTLINITNTDALRKQYDSLKPNNKVATYADSMVFMHIRDELLRRRIDI